ncbi:MAG: hypothetical protein HYY18_08915 [Planctomycetes bacterium]|nr:hypothetical protein [Planctomycetota bacterium]
MNTLPLTLLAQEAAAADPGFWGGPGMQAFGLWVAVGFTLAIYTFLYRDNPVFKFAEHVFVGVSNGYLLCYTWFTVVKPMLVVPLWHAIRPPADKPLEANETLWLLVPAFLSLCMLMRFVPKAAWMSRWAFAFMVGTTSGVLIPLTVQAQIYKQLFPMLGGFVSRGGDTDAVLWVASLKSLLILIGVFAVLTYFLFSVEHKGPVRVFARTGIVFLMIAFGASFGYTVMARESLLIGRVKFLITQAGSEGKYRTFAMMAVVVALVAALEMLRVRATPPPAAEPAPPEAK